jgi:hypothetical protein
MFARGFLELAILRLRFGESQAARKHLGRSAR